MHLLLFGYGISLLLNKNASGGGYPLEQDDNLPAPNALNSSSLLLSCLIKGKSTFPHRLFSWMEMSLWIAHRCKYWQLVSEFKLSIKAVEVTVLLSCSFMMWPKERQDFDFRKPSLPMLFFQSECRAEFSGGNAFNCIYKKKIGNMPAWWSSAENHLIAIAGNVT